MTKREDTSEIVLTPLPNRGNNTTQINTAIQNYSEVILTGGEFYVEKVPGQSHFIKMHSDRKLIFRNGARLKIKNTNVDYYQIIQCFGINNFIIENPYVIGDYGQNMATPGYWGEGITVYGCKNFQIYNMRADDCFGSGLMIADYKPNGDESVIIHPENGYISRVHVENSKFQGVSLTSGINIRIDEIYAKNINESDPSCALDIETDFHYAVLKNINIGKVTSIDCRGGVDILPGKYKEKSAPEQISINIGEVFIENQGKFRVFGLEGRKIYGYINVDRVVCYNTDRTFYLEHVPPGMFINIKSIRGINTGVYNDTDQIGGNAPVYIENTLTADSMGDVTIDNIEIIEKPTALSSLFLKDAYSGEIKKTCTIKNIKATKPMKIHSCNAFDISGDLKLNATSLSEQNWFTYHYWGLRYTNDNAITNKILNVANHFSGFKQIVENTTEGMYIGMSFSAETVIYPTSLRFANGFKSRKKGSKISFVITKPNEVVITDLAGDWESITVS